MVLVNTVISIAIKTIEFIFAPIHIIISGPNDILRREFKTVRYGSNILAIVLLLHKIVAINNPIMLANEKLIIVSYNVM